MLDFTFTEEQEMLRDTVRKFMQREVSLDFAHEIDEKEEFPDELWQKMASLGWTGLLFTEEYGGYGGSVIDQALIINELSRGLFVSGFVYLLTTCFGGNTLNVFGTEEQKKKYLTGISSGKYRWALALSEPEAGSDAANIKTEVVLDGDHWVLNGMKHFITNGDIAHIFTTMVVTDKTKGSRGGITAFIIEKDMPGFYVGTIEKKMGLRGSNSSELIFDNCMVPTENVIGGDAMIGQGFKTAMRVLDKGRLTMGACALGASQKLLDMCVDYAKQRVQFGKPIGQFQMVQAMLADMATEIYAGRQMLYHAAWLRDQGKRITREAAMVKLFCTEMGSWIADKAIQIFGGMGYMKEVPVEMFYRDVRLYRIFEGTSEIQRIVIARDLLKE